MKTKSIKHNIKILSFSTRSTDTGTSGIKAVSDITKVTGTSDSRKIKYGEN